MCGVEFSDRARVGYDAPYRCSIELLVEIHVLVADLDELLVELHAIRDFLKVCRIFKGHFNKSDRFNERILLEPLGKQNRGFSSYFALLESQVDDSWLLILEH